MKDKLHRVFRHPNPRTKARLIKDGYVPRRGGANKLTLEDLYYIDELEGKSDAPPPKPEPVVPKVEEPKRVLTDDEIGEACVAIILDLYAKLPTAQVIPFKKTKDGPK